MAPMFVVMAKLGWVGSIWAVILPWVVTAFGVFFMRQYLLTAVPDVRTAMEELSRGDITTMVPPALPVPKSDPPTIEEQEAIFSWPPSRILPVMAYNYFAVATKNDPDLALEGTIAAITAQTDPAIQTGMATGFVTAHPEMKPALYTALSEKNVALPNVEPTNQAAPPPVDTTAPLFKPVVAEGG